MKKLLALIMILVLALGMSVWADAEEASNPIREKYQEYLAFAAGNSSSDDPNGLNKMFSMAANAAGDKVSLELAFLPAESTIVRPWYMRMKSAAEQEGDLGQTYMQALYTAQQLEQVGVSVWDLQKIVVEPGFTGEVAFSLNLFNELKWGEDRFGFFAIVMNEAYANDEVCLVACFKPEPGIDPETAKRLEVDESAVIHELVFVCIPDQDFVFDIVNDMFHGESTRPFVSNDLIEWLSRRPESGFLAPVIIADEETETPAVQPEKYVRIQEKGDVNVRQKPNTESKRLGRAKAGEEYKWLSTASNGWYEIQLDEDTTGYVSHKVTTLIEK